MSLKAAIRKVDLGLMFDDMCNYGILSEKFLNLYNLSRDICKELTYMHNSFKKRNNKLKSYISSLKTHMLHFRAVKQQILSTPPGGLDEIEDLIISCMQDFCKSEVPKKILPLNNSLKLHVKTNFTTTAPFICGFKYSDFHEQIEHLYNLSQLTDKFYEQYMKPNFNFNDHIDKICQLLEELDRRREVRCDRIPNYIRKIAETNILDMEELNRDYLETNNKKLFALTLFDRLLKAKDTSDTFHIDVRTLSQIKRLLAYVQKKQSNQRISNMTEVGNSLIGMIPSTN